MQAKPKVGPKQKAVRFKLIVGEDDKGKPAYSVVSENLDFYISRIRGCGLGIDIFDRKMKDPDEAHIESRQDLGSVEDAILLCVDLTKMRKEGKY